MERPGGFPRVDHPKASLGPSPIGPYRPPQLDDGGGHHRDQLAVDGAEDPCGETERDRRLIRLADALHDGGDISDVLWLALSTEFDQPPLLDLTMRYDSYHAISFTAGLTRIPLEPGTPTFDSIRTD